MDRSRVAYFVHDVNDPAVARRVAMLRAAGATPVVLGFRRDERVPASVAGASVVDLGRTGDGQLLQRVQMVLANVLRPAAIIAAARDADVLIARNLEALALAVRARRAKPGARLVYECLDIHRTLLGQSLPARVVQAVEAALLRSIDLLIVSSPAFLREHFAKRRSLTAPSLLVENKLLALDAVPAPIAPPPGPPWTIGWFGNLRCARTFAVLTRLAREGEGAVQVLIAGRPSPAVFTDFAAQVEDAPNCRYAGPFAPADLPALYGQCHFAWAIDYFEEGLNSQWLLPNRLYEASSFGAVPIALRGVETGRWLAAHGAGVLLDDRDPVAALHPVLLDLDEAGYAALRGAMDRIPRDALIADRADCDALLQAVRGR